MKENDLYIIEKIIKKVGNKYLVKWKSYDVFKCVHYFHIFIG